jgi:hypothetical protein
MDSSYSRGIMVFMSDVIQILSQIEQGDRLAAEQLLPLVYHELRRLDVQKIAFEKQGQTLQATALVHEAGCGKTCLPTGGARIEGRWEVLETG